MSALATCPEHGVYYSACDGCERDAAFVRTIPLAISGGTGDVFPNNADVNRFDIGLRDGRVFHSVGIHGAGGILRRMPALSALSYIETAMSRHACFRVYLVAGWWGEWTVDIPMTAISYVDARSSMAVPDWCDECREKLDARAFWQS